MDVRTVHRFLAELTGKHHVPLDFEAILERQYRSFLKPDATIIDVGAHAGRHTRVFLEVAPRGRILAVEPLPDKAQGLREAFGASVQLFEGALGESSGRVKFVWAQGTPEESGLRQRQYNDPVHARPTEIEVEVTTLDAFGGGLDRCDFIKVDVEGAELIALRGGTAVLDRLRPIVSVEFGRPAYSAYGHAPRELFDYAEQRNYRLHDIFFNPVEDMETWLAIVDRATWDYFMIPKEAGPIAQALEQPAIFAAPDAALAASRQPSFWDRLLGR